MIPTFTIDAAQASFEELVARAEAGAEIIIARGETPIARLLPMENAPGDLDPLDDRS